MGCGPPLTQGETKSKLENDSLVIATRTFLDDSWVDVATVNSGDDALLASLVGSRSYMLGLISASKISWSTLSTNLVQEARLVEQDPLQVLLSRPTMVFGHLLSSHR